MQFKCIELGVSGQLLWAAPAASNFIQVFLRNNNNGTTFSQEVQPPELHTR